jgi:predicted molibdopterin-dependent oxidoreductase YjgC
MAQQQQQQIEITVNGARHAFAAGTMLIDALATLGIEVPTLCHDQRLMPYGGCRVCVVARRDGRGGLVPACSTPVQRGMQIETDAPDVIASRRQTLELLILDHRMECPVCDRATDCRLQDLVYRYGTPGQQLPFECRERPFDDRAPVIVRDPEKCVLCGKCVRLCDEVQGVAAIGLVDRGLGTRVTTLLDRPLDCEFCGQCVNACPVGALIARPYTGSAPVWLRDSATTTCSFCSCSCEITVQTHEGQLASVTSSESAEPNHGKLCVRGWMGWDVLSSEERIVRPLVRKDGQLVETSWQEAIEAAAGAFERARHQARPIVGIASARMTLEDAYAMQRLLRGGLGSCHVDTGLVGGAEALVEGMLPATGAPFSTATFDDLAQADVSLVLRADPTRTHPLVKTELLEAVRRRGQHLVLAHPLSGGLERHAQSFLPLEPATEELLLRGVARRVLALRSAAAGALEDAPGFGEWAKSLEPYTPEVVEKATGVPAAKLEALAERLAAAERPVAVVVTGIGIPGDEAPATRAAADLMALVGGRVMVLGEKCNLQGVVAAGLHHRLLPGGRMVADAAARAEIEEIWHATLPQGEPWSSREALRRAAAGDVGVLFLAGQDPSGAWPQGDLPREGISGADVLIVQDAFMTQAARVADIVLPVRILGERNGSLIGADGIRRPLERVVEPPAPLPQDGELFQQFARRLAIDLPGGGALEAEMDRLGVGAARSDSTPRFEPVAPPPQRPRIEGMLLDASPQLFHSGAVTTHSELLQELSPAVAARIAPVDALRLGLRNGDLVRLVSHDRELLLRARLDETVRPSTVVVQWHGKGETAAGLMVDAGQPTTVELRRP